MKLFVIYDSPAIGQVEQRELPDEAPDMPAPWLRQTKEQVSAWVAAVEAARVPESITRRQFMKALLAVFNMTEADVEALIDQLPAGQDREFARIDFRTATEFRRQHPTVIALATLAGKNAAQLDDLFRYGATLE